MLGISGTELVLILFFGFLIFGPEKLPQMGRTIGRAIRQFRTASDSMNQKFKDEVADPFKDAVSPYTDDIKDVAAPIKDDIDAINKNLRDVQNTVTNPIKSVFSTQQDEHSDMATRKTAAVIAGSATSSAPATQSAQPATTTEAPATIRSRACSPRRRQAPRASKKTLRRTSPRLSRSPTTAAR